MEEQEILNLETGTKESVTLKPKTVKIVEVHIDSVGEKGNKKLVCDAKHPDKEDPIKISATKHEAKGGKLAVTGLWVNLDEDNKIRKGSALAELLKFCNVAKPAELEGKELETAEDDGGFLCFKAY